MARQGRRTVRAASLAAMAGVLVMCTLPAAAQTTAAEDRAGREKIPIPILISDHHADHAFWFLRNAGNEDTDLLVLDAHADTEAHP
ncbi:MAG: hypothetical protein LBL44_06640, partial [Treponema sp.]|nr:hypothetical protein [Treponema sp.]